VGQGVPADEFGLDLAAVVLQEEDVADMLCLGPVPVFGLGWVLWLNKGAGGVLEGGEGRGWWVQGGGGVGNGRKGRHGGLYKDYK